MNQQDLINLIEKQKAEIDSLKEKIHRANKLILASKYVINVSNKFFSEAITKLEVAVNEYDNEIIPSRVTNPSNLKQVKKI